MHEAAVGFHCPECVRSGSQSVRSARTIAGGTITAKPGAITQGLIALNVGAFVLMWLVPALERWSVMSVGSIYLQQEYHRFLTANVVHFGVMHLAFNALALWIFGTYVESMLGAWRYVASLLVLGVGSSVAVYWWSSPISVTGGASGVVFGLFAIAFALMVRQRQNVTGMVVLLAINGFYSLSGNISWQAHLGGFLVGACLGGLFGWAPRQNRQRWHTLGISAIVVALVALTALRTWNIDAMFGA